MLGKTILSVLCLGLMLSMGCSRQEQANNHAADDGLIRMEPDEILISIDGNELTYGQAIRQVELRLGGPPPPSMDPERVAMIERRTFAAVVDDFIRRELLLAEARRLGIEPEAENIAYALQMIESTAKDGTPAPTGMFYEGPDSLRQEVIAGLTIEKLLASELPPLETPAEEEITAYVEKFPDMKIMPARARARHIFLALQPDADPAIAEQRRADLEDTRGRLTEGADFSQTATMISQDGSAARGGDLGIVVKGRGDPAVDQAVFSQPIGEIGPIVRSAAGLHIIQVLERTEERPATNEQILEIMRRNQRAEDIALYIRALRKRTEIRHSPVIQPLPDNH